MERIIREFDGFREVVYVADPENYNLMFINKAGLQALGYREREQVKGKKCYEVLHGLDHPCEFCTNHQLCREQYLEWVHEDHIAGRSYQIKDKLISWEGRDVRMEIAEDVAEAAVYDMEAQKQSRMNSERIVLECVKMMYSSLETDIALNNALRVLGTSLGSERTYIFHVFGKYMDNTYEWCAEGVSKEIDTLQNVPVTTIDRWMPFFMRNECVIIEDLEEIRDYAPDEYEILKRQKVHSLITVPMMEKERLVGYFGVDNPRTGNLNEMSNILKMLAYFLQSLLERKKREDYLRKIGFTDAMTGALNRNAYIRDTMSEDNGGLVSIGCFFIDINGLKRNNDIFGHETGDELIRKIYQIVSSGVKDYPVYRLGGDEFVVLCQNIAKPEFDSMESVLRQELSGKHGCSAAVGGGYSEAPNDLGAVIEEADQRMYKDKEQYYRNINIRFSSEYLKSEVKA